MTLYNLGSINADYFYRLPHLPKPGETIAALDRTTGLGGKGANQSVAAARAGAHVIHIGAVGADGQWAIDRMRGYGVDTTHIATIDAPTAHAIITLDPSGENAIIIYPGANAEQSIDRINAALADAGPGDMLILQNETSHQAQAAQIAHARGMTVAYSAAPFDIAAVRAVLPYVSILLVNEIEAAQLEAALGHPLATLNVANILITKGANGADWHDLNTGEMTSVPAFKVTAIDTTGAGDTFAGYALAALALGETPAHALRLAAAASAIKVTRKGTADAIPTRAEVDTFKGGQ